MKFAEGLYRTAHNCHVGYRYNNWGLSTLRLWVDRIVKPASVLEIGCGNGKLCKLLVDMGYDVTGLDIVPGPYDRSGYNFVRHDITLGYLPFEDNTFDYCMSFDVLEHLPPKWIDHHIWDMYRVAPTVIASVGCFEAQPFHETVKPPEWWMEKFNRLCDGSHKEFHISTDMKNRQRLLFCGQKKEKRNDTKNHKPVQEEENKRAEG